MPAARTQPKAFVQGTLPFGSSKRVLNTQNNKKSSSQTTKTPTFRKTSSSEDSSPDTIEAFSTRAPSSEDDSIEEEPAKIERLTPLPARKPELETPTTILQNKNIIESQESTSLLELDDKDPKWRKHYEFVFKRMGEMRPIHAQGQTKIHEILRVFDMSYEYGPCVGVSRLERWKRAEALGLNPPPEVGEILTTRQGTEQRDYKQSVLFDEV